MFESVRRPARFVVLLATFFALFGAAAVARLVREEQGAVDSPIGRFVLLVVLTALLISAATAASAARRTRRIAVALAAVSIALQVAHELVESPALDLTRHVALVAFLGYTTWTIVRTLFQPTVVDVETICASLCAYLLIGLMWAVMYSLVAVLDPAAFRLPEPGETLHIGRGRAIHALYFSYVTLTTVGYGDIVPATSAARVLAIIEAMVGQLLLVVLVARLVGLNVAQAALPSTGVADSSAAGGRS